MGFRGRLRNIERGMRGDLGAFALRDGTRFYYDRTKTQAALFVYSYSVQIGEEAVVPEVLHRLVEARDVAAALDELEAEKTLGEVVDLGTLVRERRIVPLEQEPTEDFSE